MLARPGTAPPHKQNMALPGSIPHGFRTSSRPYKGYWEPVHACRIQQELKGDEHTSCDQSHACVCLQPSSNTGCSWNILTTLCVLVASSLSAWHRFRYMHSADRAAKLAAPWTWTSCGTNSPHSCFCSSLLFCFSHIICLCKVIHGVQHQQRYHEKASPGEYAQILQWSFPRKQDKL